MARKFTRPLALLAYATLCAVEAENTEGRGGDHCQVRHLLDQAARAQADAERMGATDYHGRCMWEWLGGQRD